jgi:hypothetical protein
VPNPDAFEGGSVIRGVIDEGERTIHRVSADLGTTAIQERADHPIDPPRLDPSEATDPCATEQTAEDRLRLVVLGVAHCDAGGAMGRGDFPECPIPKLARAGLDRSALTRHRYATGVEWHPERASKRRHLLDLRGGLWPEPVVDRCAAERDAQLST